MDVQNKRKEKAAQHGNASQSLPIGAATVPQEEIASAEKKIAKRKRTGRLATIPNLLSVIRVAMIPVIVWLYIYKNRPDLTLLMLLLSGITDTVDGWIARRFDMVTDIGKIIDPIADKLTQAAVILCLAFVNEYMRYLFITLVVKEIAMGITGLIYIKKTGMVNSAKWYGKLTTWLLYIAVMAHIAFPNMPIIASQLIAGLCIFAIILSFLLYQISYYEGAANKRLPWLRPKPKVVIGIAAVGVIVSLILYLDISVDDIVAYTPSSVPIAALVMLLLYAFKSVTWLISLQILHLAGGVMFPLALALAVNIAGTAIAITLPYYIGKIKGRKYFDKLVQKHPKLLRLTSFSNRNPFLASLFVRGIGLTSLDPASIYFGAIRTPYAMYMLGGMLGLLPTLIVRTALGSTAEDTGSVGFAISVTAYALVLLAVAITAIVIWIRVRKSKRELEPTELEPTELKQIEDVSE